jgi:phosphohistidine swiveling domain-containing protein
MTEARRTIDTEPHPVFDTYSTGNLAEVAPHRLSPMAWSLIGDPVERGNRALVERLWPSATWHTGSHYAFVGYFACRPYHNLSAYCHMATQVPRMTAEHLIASYFQDVDPPEEHRGLGMGTTARLASVPRLVRELLSLRPKLTELEARVTIAEEEARVALSAGMPHVLGAAFAETRRVLDEAWDLHYATTATLVPLQAMQRGVGQRIVDYWNEIEGSLSRPSELAWSALYDGGERRASLVTGDFLDLAFYEIADHLEPWASISRRTRPGRWDEGSEGSERGVADVAWSIIPRARYALLPQLSRAVGDTMACRERSKSLAMRTLHVMRRLIDALAPSVGLADDEWPYVTVAELANAHLHGDVRALAGRRRDECLAALEVEMPDIYRPSVDGQHGELPAAPAVKPKKRKGRGVSPGAVTGVVVMPPISEGRDGQRRVLVCDSADADIQPDLAQVDGVITARGSLLSHISIIAREYKIPAVVGHPLAGELRPGQVVSLDGFTGAVDVIDEQSG